MNFSRKLNNKTQSLVEVYKRETEGEKFNTGAGNTLLTDSEDTLDLNNLATRSGNKYPTLPASTMSNPTTSTSTATNNSLTTTNAPIRVLPTSASVRQFSGQDADYSAYEFLSLCEDVMKGSNVVTDDDKMSFIRSRLVPGSRALSLMNSSAFHVDDIGKDYNKFKRNFLKIFGGGPKTSLVKQITHSVEKVKSYESTSNVWDGLAGASQLAKELVKSLEDSQWITGDSLSKERAKDIFELMYYMFQASGRTKRAALSLSFKPGDKVVDFITNLETKLMEHDHQTDPLTSVAAPLMMPEEKQTYVAAATKELEICSYCKKPNHHESRCYRRLKEVQKTAPPAGDMNKSCRPKTSNPCNRHQNKDYTDSARSTPPSRGSVHKGSGHYCVVHGNCAHSTETCRNIAKLRSDMTHRGAMGNAKPSGEDSRTFVRKPD